MHTRIRKILVADPDSSLQLINQQLTIVQRTNSKKMRCVYLSNMGGYYWVKGKLDLALEKFMGSLELAKEIKDINQESGQYNNIAIIYNDLNNVEKSIEYNLLSLKLARTIGLKGQLVSYNNLGNIYEKAEQYEKGLAYLDSGLMLVDRVKNPYLEALVYQNKASIYNKIGKPLEAIPLTKKSISIARTIDDKKTQVHALLRQAEAYVQLDNDQDAEKTLQRTLELCAILNFHEGYRDAYEVLYEISQRAHNETKALNYYTLYTSYKDSLFDPLAVSKISALENKSEIAHREGKIVLLEEEREKLYTNLFMAITAAAIIIFLLYSLYVYQRQRAEQKAIALFLLKEQQRLMIEELNKTQQDNAALKDHLESKERELLSFTIDWEREKQLIQEMNETVKQHAYADGDYAMVPQLKATLSRSKANELEWEEFKVRFEGVHDGFLTRVVQHAPKLTSSDLKLCAFLKMNLNSKQIANLLNIEPSSVDMARYRLRRKLNLGPKSNLIDFINRI